MTDRLRCRLCNLTIDVSVEDEDSAIWDMVHHVAQRHPGDPLLNNPSVVVLESTDKETP